VGNVSYELRTPLTTIIGYAELLDRQSSALPSGPRVYVASVRTSRRSWRARIDDVLDMATIDAGELALNLGDVAVLDLLNAARDRAMREVGASEVAIDVTATTAWRDPSRRAAPGPGAGPPAGERAAATPPGGTIYLRARRAFSHVQFEVQDTGRGIPFHVQANIFDRFVSRDAAARASAWPWSRRWWSCTAAGSRWKASRAWALPSFAICPSARYGGSAAPELQLGAA
jgi:signal transduction histidine kinase